MRQHLMAALAALMATAALAAGAPAAAAASSGQHVTGNVHLTARQVFNVESIVRRLPTCRPNQVTGCRLRTGHHNIVASFTADGFSYFARTHRGRLAHVEAYRISGTWQARRRHALHMDRAHRARYVRRLAAHMRPCAMEDSRNCVWRGHTAGNGVGRSFIDLAGVTFYFNGRVRRYV